MKYIQHHYLRKTTLVFLFIAVLHGSLSAQKPRKNIQNLVSDTIDVLHYNINLNIINLSQKTIGGFTDLTIVPKLNNTSKFSLDLLALTVDSIKYNNSILTTFSHNDTVIKINLPGSIGLTDTFHLKVYYHGQPVEDPSTWGGFYFTPDSTYAYNLGVGFESVPHNFGRVWFPCLDDFVDRAFYDCHIRVKNSNSVVCGGTLISTINNGDGTSTYNWKLNNSIPTYLASVAVANLVPVSDVFNGMNGAIPIKIYTRPQDTLKAKTSFINLKQILSIFENRFGPYKWERAGYVGVPFNSGAMEHATNIAYPNACITGTLDYEYLYAHELSHHWFGDLTTCASADDMWINEGWASFCETIFTEGLYGNTSYKNYVKTNHYNVLTTAHLDDAGYRALYGIPLQYTYGTTVYKKGSDVITTLRNYMGDTKFFNSVKALLNTYSYKDISTVQFRDFLSINSGINLNDFFQTWVYSPGFPHFSIDSITPYSGPGGNYKVYVKQKLFHMPTYGNSNKVEVTFMNNNWEKYTDTISFSGQTGNKICNVPFIPDFVMMDLEEKTADATTDYYRTLKTNGNHTFPNANFAVDVQNISDSLFIRVEHNWVAPDPLQSPSSEIYRISNSRYWKIDGIFAGNASLKGRFNYVKSGFESSLLPATYSADSIILLYRKNAGEDWRIIAFTKTGGVNVGNLYCENMQPGEYTFGIGKPFQSGINSNATNNISLKVFPNPSNTEFNIQYSVKENSEIRIFDSNSKIIDTLKLEIGENTIKWNPKNHSKGTYFIELISKGNVILQNKVIYLK
ncbi:MAG: T9SS type A sorting domain-containing protein [Bacteroidetes bacterium]|nr:T9SS type A sorting domain-containing protein [Bacteroidota bacterium]